MGGALKGGGGIQSGIVSAVKDMGKVTVATNVQGGSGNISGLVMSINDKLAGALIKGSIIGGSGGRSGQVGAGLDAGAVTVLGSITGGDGISSGLVYSNHGKIASVTVGGSVTARLVSAAARSPGIRHSAR